VGTSKDLEQQFRIDGEVAVVAGGGGGVGRAVALIYARLGAFVAVLDQDGSSAETTLREIEKAGGAGSAHALDISDEARTAEVIDAIAASRGRIDILVNAAAIVLRMPSLDVTLAAWNRVLDVNLTGLFLVSRNAARHMIARHSGRIVNVASIGGLSAGITGRQYPNASYRASKGGVINLTRALAVEWAGQGIRVNAVAPGYVRTQLLQSITADPARLKTVESNIPLGRICEPDDIAWAIVFLTSHASAMITGQILTVDGGLLA